MTNADPLHLPDDHDDDIVVDMTTAPEEWAFFPAHASRIGRRSRLKLIKSVRHEEPRADTGADVPSVPEPAAEVLSDEKSTDPEPRHEELAADQLVEDDRSSVEGPMLGSSEPLAVEVSPSEATDDEPTTDDDAEPVDELLHVSDVVSVVVDDAVASSSGDDPSVEDDGIAEAVRAETPAETPVRSRAPRKPSKRKPAPRKPDQRKPAQRKTAPRKTSDALRAARRDASERVRAASDESASVAHKAEPERSTTAKRLLLAALALVVAAVGVGSWYLYLRDDTPAAPEPTPIVDPLSAYAQGEGGVTAGSKLGFRAVFPGSPERETYRLPGPGKDVRFDSLSFRRGDAEFEAVRIDVPASVDVSDASSVLRNAADTSARIRAGTVEEYGEITVNGDRAAASIVSTKDGSYLQSQAILHEQTLFVVRIESKERTHPAFDRFASEFAIL